MKDIQHCGCTPVNPSDMTRANWSYQSIQIAKAQIAVEQSTDIQIQTTDGDKVTLSSDIAFESSAIVYEKIGQTSSAYSHLQGQSLSANASRKLELTVEGTLDEQEKREIKAVLKNLFKMVKNFLTGKSAFDTDEAQKFADLTTISNVKAEFDIKTEVAIAAHSSVQQTVRTPVEERSTMQEKEAANIPLVSKRVDKLTDRMIGLVNDSDIEPSKILERLNSRLSRYSGNLIQAGPAGWHRMRMIKAIMEDFARKLRKLSAENDVGENKELTDSQTALGADSDPVVETTALSTETVLNVAGREHHFEMEYSAADAE